MDSVKYFYINYSGKHRGADKEWYEMQLQVSKYLTLYRVENNEMIVDKYSEETEYEGFKYEEVGSNPQADKEGS